MQKVVAYRLERRDLDSDSARATVATELEAIVQRWLDSKGASASVDDTGTFRSQSLGAPATFRWERAAVDQRSWQMVQLDEDQPGGRRFTTAVSITNTGSALLVYASLSSGTAASTVAPVEVGDPRCPRVVHEILKHSPHWRHGETLIEGFRPTNGADMGRVVAEAILSPARTLPIIVVTDDDDGELLLDGIDEKIAHEVSGLASVVRADQLAAWELTKVLGPSWSCYYGAVRLFWPHFRRDDRPRQHPRWRPDDIFALSDDDREAARLLSGEIRGAVFRAAALNVQRPTEIEEIRSAHGRARIAESRARSNADGGADFEAIAESYADENDRLRVENTSLQDENSALKVQVANAEAVAAASAPRNKTAGADPEPEPTPSEPSESGPASGEIRYYKKTGRGGKFDRMVRVQGCNHDNWQGAHAADKARKGILSLEQSREWKAMWHCVECTGGGMWKVRW